MKVWELHSQGVDGAITTTPDGEADVVGLIMSEKAYFVVMRDYRPAALVALVRREGPAEAAKTLLAHFNEPEALQAGGGRGLAAARSGIGGLGLVRADEVPANESLGRRG